MGEKPILRGKRVFVTGHTGFTGTWLTMALRRMDATVMGYSLPPPTRPSLFDLIWREGSKMPLLDVRGDIRDLAALRRRVREFRPDLVMHLAAQSLVREGFAHPVDTFQANLVGTVNVLEAVRASPRTRAVVVVTSDKCYRNLGQGRPFTEQDPLGGDDPYSSSKACAELAAAAYYRTYLASRAVALATARAGNILGGGDWAKDRVVPDVVRALSRGRSVAVRNPSSVRPWQYVLDVVGGYLTLAGKLLSEPQRYSGAWNFAPRSHQRHTVAELVRRAIAAWGRGRYHTVKSRVAFQEAPTLRLNPERALRTLGWQARYDFETTVRRTIHWYREYYDGRSSPRELCEHELTDYGLAD